mmetsp:Transcript_7523/g.19134  ORF Transcript_7523/g.19134 Transcript_7523/m.19134 type:complete len:192 (+) Transcript_7523:3-578(+)
MMEGGVAPAHPLMVKTGSGSGGNWGGGIISPAGPPGRASEAMSTISSQAMSKSPMMKRRVSVIDTGRSTPSRLASGSAARAGIGRLFLEVGALARGDYFGDTVLVRKTKQAATIVTTSSTRCYVLNKWDFLRRVEKSVVEQLQLNTATRSGVTNDRALIREFQRSREWADYKNGLVDDIVAQKKALTAQLR